MSEIRYYNRYTQREEIEEVYGEGFLRWTYETVPGRMSLWMLARRRFFSQWYGWRMSRPASAARVAPFVAKYELDADAFLQPLESYSSFNDFFYRKLKAGARPLVGDQDTVALPADGRHLGIANLDSHGAVYAKGQSFDLAEFLGDAPWAKSFQGGCGVISRLCPVDYHRFHSPVEGRLADQRLVNGWLYSVSPIALRRSLAYLWENKRVATLIESERFGRVAYVAIGATCVGTIKMERGVGDHVARGEELGYFAFGGSCVVTLFEKGRVVLAEDLARHGSEGFEVYAKVGDALGRAP